MPAPLVERAMASRTSRSPAGKRASQASWSVRAAEEALRQAITLVELDDELDDRLSRLTWFEIGLAAERPTPLDGGTWRRRNRFATLRPDGAAGRTTLARATRVRALRYLLREVQGLRTELAAKGRLTVTQLTRARWLFGGHPGPLRDYFASVAGRSGQTAPAMLDALTIEEGLLIRTLKLMRRVPDSVAWLAPGRLRRLSFRQLVRLLAAARRELREATLLFELAVRFCETKPPQN